MWIFPSHSSLSWARGEEQEEDENVDISLSVLVIMDKGRGIGGGVCGYFPLIPRYHLQGARNRRRSMWIFPSHSSVSWTRGEE